MKRLVITSSLLIIAIILSACGGGKSEEIIMDEPIPPGGENAYKVELEFSADEIIPNIVTIPADTDILLVIYNSDTKPGDLNEDHNLVGPDIGLNEIIVRPGQTVRRLWHSYDVPGEYRIGCTIHPWIDMTIIIQESP
jgi:hypothetical protein